MTIDEWTSMSKRQQREWRAEEDRRWLDSAWPDSPSAPVTPATAADTAEWLADIEEAGGGRCGPEGND